MLGSGIAPAVIEAPGECRENHYVISELARRLGAKHRGFDMTPWEIMDETLKVSNMWDAETNWQKGGQDFHLGFETSHFLDGFAWPDKRYRFAPDWQAVAVKGGYLWVCDPNEMPRFAGMRANIEGFQEVHGFINLDRISKIP